MSPNMPTGLDSLYKQSTITFSDNSRESGGMFQRPHTRSPSSGERHVGSSGNQTSLSFAEDVSDYRLKYSKWLPKAESEDVEENAASPAVPRQQLHQSAEVNGNTSSRATERRFIVLIYSSDF